MNRNESGTYLWNGSASLSLRAENRTSKMQVFDVSHMGGFGGGGGCNNVLGVCR